MASRRRRNNGQVWIVVEVRAPRWAVWYVAVGSVLLGLAAVGCVWLVAAR